MKKISLYIAAILTMIFFLMPFYVKADSSSIKVNLPTASPSRYALPTLSFGTPAPTFTPTLDYEKLGLPSPTITPTLDYVQLASEYLTPFPTSTAIIPPWTPTSTPENPLLNIVAKKLPSDWTPTPLPFGDAFRSSPKNEARIYIQAITDLMNFVNADQKLFSQYYGAHWFLKNDFDNDGNPEWLVSVPVRFKDKNIPCCSQYIVLFEKIGDIYQPVHYDKSFEHNEITKVILVDDLNNDSHLEIVLRTLSCGTACGQTLNIATWNGNNWTSRYIQSVPTSLISYLDSDNDGKTEVILEYMTYYKLDSAYPPRHAIDVYGWKDDEMMIVEEYRQPTTNTYGILRDVYSAISFGKIEEALDLAQPVIDNLEQTCGPKETYIGIEAMLAYGTQNNSKAMQSTLLKIMAHCNQPSNGFTHAANVLWQAYQQVHDPIVACEAMKRFIIDDIRQSTESSSDFQFFDATVMLPKNYYNFCPFQQQ